MINIKNKAAIQKMSMAGNLLSQIFDNVPEMLTPGISTLEINSWFEKQLAQKDLVPKAKGYKGYKHATCISINEEVVHGIPKTARILSDGDLLKIDVCASWQGYCADMARCFFIGTVSNEIKRLVEVTQKALDQGINKAWPNNKLSDISAAIQQEVEKHGYGVVRDFAGHGIGKQMHEEPEILNYGKPGHGPILRTGMAFAIEPMITLGNYDVYIESDGWTVKTTDKSVAAHIEDTIIITDNGPKILTRKQNGSVV